MSELNKWWLSLSSKERKVIIEDKWMLAERAFAAGKASKEEKKCQKSK